MPLRHWVKSKENPTFGGSKGSWRSLAAGAFVRRETTRLSPVNLASASSAFQGSPVLRYTSGHESNQRDSQKNGLIATFGVWTNQQNTCYRNFRRKEDGLFGQPGFVWKETIVHVDFLSGLDYHEVIFQMEPKWNHLANHDFIAHNPTNASTK